MHPDTPALPAYLAERLRPLNAAPVRRGRYMLYWMHHAMRGDENPALETALALGAAQGLPVLVYQGLAGRHRYNSDRHHFFILQGARDVARALAERGIRYVFHLPTDEQDRSPLPRLCREAAAVVVEEMPVPPFDRWQPALAARLDCAAWAVDARCVYPMRLADQAFDRAFRFRQAVRLRSNQQAVFLDSAGRSYSLAAHTLPSARGYGEPLTGRFTPAPGETFTAILMGADDQKYLVASDAGYGFLVALGELYTKNRSGKVVSG